MNLCDFWSDLSARSILNPDLAAKAIVWTSVATKQAVTIYGTIRTQETGRESQKGDGVWVDRDGQLAVPPNNYQAGDTFQLPSGETWHYGGSNPTGNDGTQTVQIEHHIRTEVGKNRKAI